MTIINTGEKEMGKEYSVERALERYPTRAEKMEILLTAFGCGWSSVDKERKLALKFSTLWAVANDIESVRKAPGFIPVEWYNPGVAIEGEIGQVENTRFLVAYDERVCRVPHEPSRRSFIAAEAKNGQFWTEM